ncbi:MAG: hypothetical protein OXP70_09555, partial [Acidobacteriota bacterium]|nr:hypothetical protein [Acidobacteriota bacterium]
MNDDAKKPERWDFSLVGEMDWDKVLKADTDSLDVIRKADMKGNALLFLFERFAQNQLSRDTHFYAVGRHPLLRT